MKITKFVLSLIMLLISLWINAQNVLDVSSGDSQQATSLLLLEDNLEELAMDREEDNAWEDELEELSRQLHEPINLNGVTRRQLERFPFLSDWQIENILAYLYIHGEMQTVYELQAVEGMDIQTIRLLSPFVCVKPLEENTVYPSIKTMARYGKHQVLTRLDVPFYTRKGYQKTYLGPSLYHSLRYNFHYGEYMQVGFSGEKDAGEPMFALNNSQGYDFYSYYLFMQHLGPIEALALGNYRLSFGQGLVLGNGFGTGKSFSLATSDYRSYGIRKHASTDEYNYFRGVAGTLLIGKKLHLSAFYSHRALDGVIKDGKITSIYKTGLHRSQAEADKKHALTLQMTGGNLTFEKGAFRVGATGIYYFFNHSYQPRLNKYARHNLQGNRFYNVGLDYRFCFGKLMASGEVAKGKKGVAALNRLQIAFSSDYRVMVLHRYYSHDYWAFFAHGWGESSTPQNENGWYVAVDIAPWAKWRFFGSLDFFSFPWWKYRISRPSQGWEGRWQATYTPFAHGLITVNYQYKQKDRDMTGSGGKDIRTTHRHKWRGRLSYQPGCWLLKTTADWVHFHSEGCRPERGWQVSQACGYLVPGWPLSVTLQGTWFHTTDYDSRVYAYEKGLLNTFYTPAYYGKGYRGSVHVRCDWNEHLMLLLKVGHTRYLDRKEIGSGNDLIASNRKTDLQLQLRVKF